MEAKPNSDWIMISKAFNDHARDEDGNVLVYKPDKTIDRTCWAEIIDIGPRCKYITKDMCESGCFILAPELSNDMKEWGTDASGECKFFFVRERFLLNDKANRAFIVRM